MVVKTFRGQLEDGGQDHIRLQTTKGKVGYRIVKFEVMDKAPGTADAELVVKIYKESQSTINATIDFTDSALLAANYHVGGNSTEETHLSSIIFDTEIFNQDIFVTHEDAGANNLPANYYIELEVIPLTDHDAEFTTLKDIRGRNTTP